MAGVVRCIVAMSLPRLVRSFHRLLVIGQYLPSKILIVVLYPQSDSTPISPQRHPLYKPKLFPSPESALTRARLSGVLTTTPRGEASNKISAARPWKPRSLVLVKASMLIYGIAGVSIGCGLWARWID